MKDMHVSFTSRHVAGAQDAPISVWSQDELGDVFAVGPISVIGELDPTGAQGIVREVMQGFGASLDPLLELFERHVANGRSSGIKFAAGKLHGTAAHMGAHRLCIACRDIGLHFSSMHYQDRPEDLTALVRALVVETVRVQRKLALLLAEPPRGTN